MFSYIYTSIHRTTEINLRFTDCQTYVIFLFELFSVSQLQTLAPQDTRRHLLQQNTFLLPFFDYLFECESIFGIN